MHSTGLPACDAYRRVVIENVRPSVDGGRFAVKRTLGETLTVTADVFADGHDEVRAVLLHRPPGDEAWQEVAMTPLGNDRFQAEFQLDRLGRHEYAVRGWVDRFEAALRRSGVEEVAVGPLSAQWARAFGAAYRDRYDADEAATDLQYVNRLNETGLPGEGKAVAVRAFRTPDDSRLQFRFKLYRRGPAVPLSDVLPILADMGLKTLEEYGYPIRPMGEEEIHVHEFLMEDPRGEALVFDDVKGPFEDAFAAVWTGRNESDGFNRLVIDFLRH